MGWPLLLLHPVHPGERHGATGNGLEQGQIRPLGVLLRWEIP